MKSYHSSNPFNFSSWSSHITKVKKFSYFRGQETTTSTRSIPRSSGNLSNPIKSSRGVATVHPYDGPGSNLGADSSSRVNDSSRSSSRSSGSSIDSKSSSSGIKKVSVSPTTSHESMKPSGSESKPLVCDKCDGKHTTSDCPHYPKEREKHPDAQKNFYKKLGGTSKLPGAIIRNGRVVRQPGDGSCLFHSLSYGLRDGSNASSLRRDICNYINKYPQMRIADTPLSDWIKWDSGGTVGSYTRRMSSGAWGGGIEMATVSMMKDVNVHVYERSMSGFTRISAFDHPTNPESKKTVRVLYCGGVHYDALVAS